MLPGELCWVEKDQKAQELSSQIFEDGVIISLNSESTLVST